MCTAYYTCRCQFECYVPFVSILGVIYLQYGDEIKRAMLPSDMSNVEQVRGLFERTFPDKFSDRNNNRKTIYIKDASCGIFYELDDVK